MVCTKTLKKTILQQNLNYKASLRKRFSNAVEVCLTADAWGSKRRSFLGVTAHWLESKGETGEMTRCSAALVCKRFQGKMETFYFLFFFYILTFFNKRIAYIRKNCGLYAKKYMTYFVT